MTLTDALAAALERQHEAFLEQPESFDSREAIAAFLLADPAFREALTAALAEAVHDLDHAGVDRPHPFHHCPAGQLYDEEAAAIVAAMLPDEPLTQQDLLDIADNSEEERGDA